MNSKENWLLSRRAGIGGSDIAAILGLSPWRSQLDVFLDKTATEKPVDQQTEPMYWGTVLEDVVAREYAMRTGRRVQRVNAMLRHPKHDWMLGNIDRAVVADGSRARLDAFGRLAGADGIVECKTVSAYKADDWAGPDGSDCLPVYYTAQAMWYLAISGADWCDVPALIGGQKYVIRRVERDDETIKGMIEKAEDFWRGHVLAGIAPEPRTGSEAARLFAKDTGELLDITSDIELQRLIDDLLTAQDSRKAAEMAEDSIKDRLQLAIGAHAGLAVDGRPVITWKAAKDSQVTDWKALASSLKPAPDLVAQFTTTKPGSRRFLIK